jgi:hypothetical protein
MSDTPAPPTPPGEFDRLNPIRPDATRVTGVTRRERREVGHIQIGERLFRLLLRRYTARIEPF